MWSGIVGSDVQNTFKKYFENNKILHKSILKIPNKILSILKIQNKILFCIFKIKHYFQNTILHITDCRHLKPVPCSIDELMQ